MPKDVRSGDMVERRSRRRKRIVVFVDRDSDSRDSAARELEAHGYHVLTAESHAEGMALVKVRRPDAVVTTDGGTEDDGWAVCHFVRSLLPARTPVILRCSVASPDGDRTPKAGDLGVALVDQSSDPGQLSAVLEELFHALPASAPGPQRDDTTRLPITP
jgi:response regulator RpfG family c-di-GMP phosphodiesterase